MNEEIRKLDKRGNLIYHKNSHGCEYWRGYDKNGNITHFKDSDDYKYWQEFNENNKLVYLKDQNGYEFWWRYNKKGEKMKITRQEFGRIKEQEFLSRKPVSRFELMEL